MPLLRLSLVSIFAIAVLFGCASSATTEGRVSAPPRSLNGMRVAGLSAKLYVPAKTRPIVYYGSNATRQQHALLFYDEAGNFYQEIDLVPQVPPGTCLVNSVAPMTLTVYGYNLATRTLANVSITQQSDARFFDVKISEDTYPQIETASIGIPTTPSNYCADP